MKVRLLAPDSKIANLAIMKLSSYHKSRGDDVGWYNPDVDKDDTELLYISKVFTFSKEPDNLPVNAKIIKGGSGYDVNSKLPEEIDSIQDLDYSIYPECDYSIVFTSRGCIRHCKFCIVPLKEGPIHQVQMPKLNPRGTYIKILDNNFFACREWRENLELLKSFNQRLEFNQGIDLRILTEEQCQALHSCRIKQVYTAWDNYKDKDLIIKQLQLLTKYVRPYLISVYVLVGFESKEITEQDVERIMTLKSFKVTPFAMGYRDFRDPDFEKTKSVIDFCRWVDNHLYKVTDWKDYDTRIRFKGRRT